MALFNDVSAMVQAASPRQMGPNSGGQSLVIGQSDQGYGPWGEALGKGVSRTIDDMYDPDKVREQAKQTNELVLKMPDELKAQLYSNPDVQARLQRYYRLNPEMFADAGMVTGNADLKGKLAFVGDQSYQAQLESTKAGTEGKKAETGLRTAQTAEVGQDTKLKQLTQDAQVAILQGKIPEAQAMLKQIEQHTASMKTDTALKEKESPVHIGLMEAQTRSADAQASRTETNQTNREASLELQQQRLKLQEQQLQNSYQKLLDSERDQKTKEVMGGFGLQWKSLETQFNRYGMMEQDKVPYANSFSGIVNNHLATAMGKKLLKLENGSDTWVPTALTHGPSAGMIQQSFDTSYLAFLDAQKRGGSQGKADMAAIANSVEKLNRNTYDYLTGKKFNRADQEALMAFTDPQTFAKIIYMQMEAERNAKTLTPETEKLYQAAIAKHGGLPRPTDPEPWWKRIFGTDRDSLDTAQDSLVGGMQ